MGVEPGGRGRAIPIPYGVDGAVRGAEMTPVGGVCTTGVSVPVPPGLKPLPNAVPTPDETIDPIPLRSASVGCERDGGRTPPPYGVPLRGTTPPPTAASSAPPWHGRPKVVGGGSWMLSIEEVGYGRSGSLNTPDRAADRAATAAAAADEDRVVTTGTAYEAAVALRDRADGASATAPRACCDLEDAAER